MVLMPRGFVNSWNRKFVRCDLCGMPCIGAKGLGLPHEDEGEWSLMKGSLCDEQAIVKPVSVRSERDKFRVLLPVGAS